MSITPVLRDYVLAIYTLEQEGRPAIGARLAERLGVTPPTVTQTLERLVRAGLIEPERREGIVLSDAGRQLAREGVRRQRLAERWLVEMLGLEWADANVTSRTMASGMSTQMADRLDAMLGHPREFEVAAASPPIGPTPDRQAFALDSAEPGSQVVLEHVGGDPEQAQALLNFLDRHDLRAGSRISVVGVEPWASTVTLRHGTQEIVLGLRAAAQLWVRPLTSDEVATTADDAIRECPDDGTYVAEVVGVMNSCPAGHKVGDLFAFGQRTPCGLCGEAFIEIHPFLDDLRDVHALAERKTAEVACPEHGNVTFEVRLGGGRETA